MPRASSGSTTTNFLGLERRLTPVGPVAIGAGALATVAGAGVMGTSRGLAQLDPNGSDHPEKEQVQKR